MPILRGAGNFFRIHRMTRFYRLSFELAASTASLLPTTPCLRAILQEAATIEFAVAGLGVKDIIICGHSHCGAMQGLLKPEMVASLPAVASWLSHAETTPRIVRDNYGHLDGDRLVTATVEENVLVQLENLRTLPPVASRLRQGKPESSSFG